MAAETLFGQAATGTTAAVDALAYTMGVQFSVPASGVQSATLAAIWWYSAAGAGTLPLSMSLWDVAGQSLVHAETPTWSGAAASGWVRAALATPQALTLGKAYKGAVTDNQGVNWYSATSLYWSTGPGGSGVTSAGGHVTAPDNAAAAQGQDTFTQNTLLAYPATAFNASNYWVDVEVDITLIPAVVPVQGGGVSMARRRMMLADL